MTEPAPQRGPRVRAFHLAVDDGGEYLVVIGTRAIAGQLRPGPGGPGGRAELPLLADLEPAHALFELEASFHGGERWQLRPLGPRAAPRADGRAVGPEGVELTQETRLALSAGVELVFSTPDATSASALLEWQHGVECRGVARTLLWVPGPSGRVRIARKRRRLISVGDLEHEVTLETDGERLAVQCAGGLAQGALRVAPGPGARAVFELPQRGSLCIELGARSRPRPPFALLVRALDDPEARGAAAARGGEGA